MTKINQLPYFQINNKKETNIIAQYLLRKIKGFLKTNYPYHYLIFSRHDKKLTYLQKLTKKYKYFLRFDIEKYYPSINHQILLNNCLALKEPFLKNFHFHSRRMRHYLKYEIPQYLQQTPIKDKGLPLGNYLSWVLAGLYLLPLDLKIKRPFLRLQDDYLIFCKKKKEPEKILKEIIEPELEKLELKINITKLNSGKFHEIPLEFLGFKYYAGIFTISEEKIEEFKNKIIKITHLTKKKPAKAIIKLLNNKILGFGHYYKFSQSKEVFDKLDAFVRQRLRRYLIKNKDQKQKIGNLLFTNQELKNLGLKSLLEIKEKYERKKKGILRKKGEKTPETGKLKRTPIFWQKAFKPDDYWQKVILSELQEITKNISELKRKIERIERKMEGED